MSNWTSEEDEELSAALGWPGGISEPLLDRAALLQLVSELRTDARRYRWHKARNPLALLMTAWADSQAACEIGDDPDAATDVAMGGH